MNRNKYFIAGAALVAVVLVVYFAVSGFPPTEQVAGTMADTTIAGVEQAERYRADAISDSDVQLDDQTINDLLQDPEVVTLLQDEDFQNALKDGSLSEALSVRGFDQLMAEGVLSEALRQFPRFKERLMANNLAPYFRQQENELARLRGYDKLRAAMLNDKLTAALESAALRQWLAATPSSKLDGALARSYASKMNFRTAFDSGLLAKAVADPQFLRAVNERSVRGDMMK